MSQSSRKPFGPIRDAYTFFLQYGTEVEADIQAYLPHLHSLATEERPLRMLDFGCGDGAFTSALLGRLHCSPARLRLSLVEPDEVYRRQAVARLQPCTTQSVCAWPALPSHLQTSFDLVLANHVLYYVADLDGTLATLRRTLAPCGLLLAAMAGQHSTFAQWCQQCFSWLGQPYPFYTAEDMEGVLIRQGVHYNKENVHYTLGFPDVEENRLTVMRFLLGSAYHEVSRQAMLALFEPYAQDGQIAMHLLHEHFMVWHQAL